VEALTGIAATGWVVLGGLILAGLLVARAAWVVRRPGGAREAMILAVAGVALAVALILLKPDTVAHLPGQLAGHWKALAAAVALLVLVLAVVDFAFRRVVPLLQRARRAPVDNARPDRDAVALLAIGLVVALLAGSALAGALVVPETAAPPAAGQTGATPSASPGQTAAPPAVDSVAPVDGVRAFDLPGGPMDLAMDGERSGYIVLDTAGVIRFTLPVDDGQALDVTTVAGGIDHGRGVALRDGTLYVVDLGPVCAVEGADCNPRVANQNPPDQDVEIATLATTSARVRAFSVDQDGSLRAGNDILSDIPVASFAHAANGLTVGADDRLYLPVGNVDWLWAAPDRVAEAHIAHPDWLGTVLRFDESGAQPEVFAHGLRNVYEIGFDPDGRMWAVDNNGPTLGGWLTEEVLQVKQSADYGYPYDGTYGTWTRRTDGPLWTSPHVGSAGLAWSDDVGLGPGLLSGSCGYLALFSLEERPIWPEDNGRWTQTDLLSRVPGCITSVVPISAHELLATVYGSAEQGKLLLVRLADGG